MPRKHESYVVRIGNAAYWPRVSQLERVATSFSSVESNETLHREMNVRSLIILGLLTDGAHHKQHYLEQIAEKLGIDLSGVEYDKEGIIQ